MDNLKNREQLKSAKSSVLEELLAFSNKLVCSKAIVSPFTRHLLDFQQSLIRTKLRLFSLIPLSVKQL